MTKTVWLNFNYSWVVLLIKFSASRARPLFTEYQGKEASANRELVKCLLLLDFFMIKGTFIIGIILLHYFTFFFCY